MIAAKLRWWQNGQRLWPMRPDMRIRAIPLDQVLPTRKMRVRTRKGQIVQMGASITEFGFGGEPSQCKPDVGNACICEDHETRAP